MVKIALAGGSGDVASEILDVLVAAKKHEIVVLSRSAKPKREPPTGVTLVTVDYDNVESLVHALKGVHTLLSFVGEVQDPTSSVQRKLIDAAVQAGVRRFAPSEWGTSKMEHLDWYAFKGATREYLKEINNDKKVLEYTLFQAGLFLNYLTYPHNSAKHLHQMDMPLNLNDRRFIMLEGGDDSRVNFVTVQDLAHIVAKAVDYEGEWPIEGGVRGTEITMGELLALSKKVRGGTFDVTKLQRSDILAGEWKASWVPVIDHPAMKALGKEALDAMSKHITGRVLLAMEAGGYVVNDNWNRLIPEYQFTKLEPFLTEAWRGKP
ncbi:NAD(P)-binding protein [Bimuria novae-zelandiae CBS 107.79]|uniref:NAD(P)-binding protein n=1 Tax=Bimuria novae-zelandiae CBS 107.79 TaxID=1447943 RepID=A0A6A5V3U7_9PLEO|nr:NAD(P)-binding protein [Bimuria novae-zelandiae CBS 107.79]